jgi:DNA-binding NtrC family response regulator
MKEDPAGRAADGSRETVKRRDENLRELDGCETLLVVEDDLPLLELMKRQLGKRGYRVLHASTTAQALAHWNENGDSVRLLLTDLRIAGGITGCQLAERLLSTRPALKVIYCSGYDRESVGSQFPLPEDAVFLAKPFMPDELARIVRETLDQRT